jgi:hypothetical protein
LPLLPLIAFLDFQVGTAVERLGEALGELLPPISASYWALLMVLTGLAFFPTAAARANRDFSKVGRQGCCSME